MYIDECLKDKITYANLEQYLKMEHKLLLSTSKAFILLLTKYNTYVVDCVDSEYENIFKELEKYDIKIITLMNKKLYELIKSKFKEINICSQAVYCGEKIENKNLKKLK